MTQSSFHINMRLSNSQALTLLVRLSIAAFLYVISALHAGAEVRHTKSIKFFLVEGRTVEELEDALERLGPEASTTGKKHPGLTEIGFGGEVTFLITDKQCAIDKVIVDLTTNIQIPRWPGRRKADLLLGEAWDVLVADIKRHEEHHAEIARQHAQNLDSALLKLKPAPDCQTLQRQINRETRNAMRAHDREQTRFDREEADTFESRFEALFNHKQAR